MWLWIVLGVIVVLLVIWVIATYNKLVKANVAVDEAFAQIEVQLKRRSDLIPNLVNTVKGYAAHERETLEAVVKARNAALALVAARLLGVPAAALAAVSAGWSAPAGRGSVHADGARTFYVDCYNASPASLLDAAAAFDRLAPAGPRLFVLGGMAELGPDSARLHRECAARLPLRAGDQVVVFGGDAPAYLAGITTAGVRATTADGIEAVTSLVTAHQGAVFLKGSRAFALERVLPPAVRAALSFH